MVALRRWRARLPNRLRPEAFLVLGQKRRTDGFRHLRRVAYASSRPAKYLLDATDDDYLYTKNHEWEHEREWRIIRNFNDAATKCGQDNSGKDILLFAIPPDCVRA